jgi:indolepyruvate ferredoxin oxidoreductase beta subunit
MKLDIVFTGVGGQGVVVLSDIFCEAAMLDGFDVAKAEVHGMAQRGGSIMCTRTSQRPNHKSTH